MTINVDVIILSLVRKKREILVPVCLNVVVFKQKTLRRNSRALGVWDKFFFFTNSTN